MPTTLSDASHAPLVVRPARAAAMLGCGITRIYQLIDAGELASFLDGHARKVTVKSIQRYINKRLAEDRSGDEQTKLRDKIDPAMAASLASRRRRR